MFRRQQSRAQSDLVLVRNVISGKNGAWKRLLEQSADTIYTACRIAFPSEEVEPAFLDMVNRLRVDNFARLKTYNGRAPLNAFIGLILRELLADRVFILLERDINRGWRLFEHFFKRDIEQLANDYHESTASVMDETESVSDWVQKVKMALIENNFARLRKHSGKGSFGGYVRSVVKNLCIEYQREVVGRRRLPAAIAKLPEFDQEVFRQINWHRKDPSTLLAYFADMQEPRRSRDEVAAAIIRVTERVPPGFIDRNRGMTELREGSYEELPDPGPTPEESILLEQEEAGYQRISEALAEAIASLTEDVRTYLWYRLYHDPPLKPSEIAAAMERPEQEVYTMAARAKAALTAMLDHLKNDPFVKNWIEAV
jgi:RNA polymerase primary sigma factor